MLDQVVDARYLDGEEQQAVHILKPDQVGCRRVTPGGEFQLPVLQSLLWARVALLPLSELGG